jgi:hypothetical protein
MVPIHGGALADSKNSKHATSNILQEDGRQNAGHKLAKLLCKFALLVGPSLPGRLALLWSNVGHGPPTGVSNAPLLGSSHW